MNFLKDNLYELIILDVNLPDTDTFLLIDQIKHIVHDQKILMFSMSSEEMYSKRFLKLGVMGFISKQASNDEFISAVNTVLKGNIYISPHMSKILASDIISGASNRSVFETLTENEFKIMSYFLKGIGSKEISNMTNLHSSTIGTYKFKIFKKLNVKNILELQELAKFHKVTE